MSRNDSNIPSEVRDALAESSGDADGSQNQRIWEKAWQLLGRAEPLEDALPDAEETWAGVQAEIDDGDQKNVDVAPNRAPRSRRSRENSRTRLWRWTTAVTAVVVLAMVGWWGTQPVNVVAPPGTTKTHTLPDGTTVELNGDTEVSYPWNYRAAAVLQADRRVVELDGEAYFDVPGDERPFIVRTDAVSVEVLGTSFTVQSRSDEEEAHVALIEGRLRVTDRARPKTKVTLRPGQATSRSQPGVLSPAQDTSLQRVTAWRHGGFAVTERTLPALARELERRFGQSVRLHPSIDEAARTDPLTLYYSQAASLETILHDICMARGLTYRATANGYVLANGRDNDSPDAP